MCISLHLSATVELHDERSVVDPVVFSPEVPRKAIRKFHQLSEHVLRSIAYCMLQKLHRFRPICREFIQ